MKLIWQVFVYDLAVSEAMAINLPHKVCFESGVIQ